MTDSSVIERSLETPTASGFGINEVTSLTAIETTVIDGAPEP